MQMEIKDGWSTNTHTDKIDFKIKTVTRDKAEHYVMIKGSIQEEDISIVSIHAPNIGYSNI